LAALRLPHRATPSQHSQTRYMWLAVLCLLRSRRARREGVLEKAEAVQRKAPITRSPHAGREVDLAGEGMEPKGRGTIEYLPELRRILLLDECCVVWE
jgi:hypothetical protein